MNLLLIPAHYPHPAAEWVGAPNEYSALALQRIVGRVEVLAPRPYAPRLLAFNEKWKAYATIQDTYVRKGIRVHRPAYPIVPRVFQAFWPNRAAFLFSRGRARALHRQIGFHAILSFDLLLTGGLAWRLGEYLGIPACGWATGSDIRLDAKSSGGRSLREALVALDTVFYQTAELKALGAQLLETYGDSVVPKRHVVQSRGILGPEFLPGKDDRCSTRSRLQIAENQVVILYLGRIARGKGVFELVDRFDDWAKRRTDLVLLLVGAIAGFDDGASLQARINSRPGAGKLIRLMPACEPHRIWEYFAAADIFAFPSFREGMPNSLLEAMLAGLPAVAFSIPAVQEIARFGNALIGIPPLDFASFGEALLRLAEDPALRRRMGEQGQAVVREHFSAHKSMKNIVQHIRGLRPDTTS